VNNRVVATLVGTFLALLVATVWVPARPAGIFSYPSDELWPSDTRYCLVWQVTDPGVPMGENLFWLGGTDLPDPRDPVRWPGELHWPPLVVELVLVLAGGGVLALYFRTRRAAA
jgi:hypothetical protein